MSHLVVVFVWLLHWLPLPVQAAVGNALGWLLYWLVAPRRRVTLTNLRLCFPDLTEAERAKLARRHFMCVARSFLERGLLWFGSRERIRRLVEVEGMEAVHGLLDAGTPVILLVPHFCALDTAATRLATEVNSVSIYSAQKNKILEKWLFHGRSRFGSQVLLRRDESIRASIKAMKEIRPFYYLPDMDNGPDDSIFVPFFGVQAATLSALPRLAKLGGAVVVPCFTRMLPGGQGYVVELGEPWRDFPGGSVEADTRRMNACIEDAVRTMPAQYYWVHRRFKTRPPGEPKLY